MGASRRRWSLLVAVAVPAAVLAGCGSSGKHTSSVAPAGSTVSIGVIAPLDGGLVGFGRDIRDGVQLAVDAANSRHAIPGRRIVLRAMDDSSDPKKGRAAAETLAGDPSVIGVVGTYNSGVARVAAPVLDAAGITMISPGNTDPALTRGDDAAQPHRQWQHYFRMVAADDVQGPFLAEQATSLGLHRAAVVSETKPVSKGLADVFAQRFAAAGGQVVLRQVVPDGTTDFGAVARSIGSTADVVFFGGEYQVAADLRKQATAAGVKAPVLGGDGIKDPAYIAAAGADSNGDLASSIGRPVATSPSAASYLQAFAKSGFKEQPGDFGPYAYDAANLLISAAAKSLSGGKSMTKAQRDAIRAAVSAADIDGVSGHLAFDEFGDTKTKVLTLYRVDGGAWKAVKTETIGAS